MSRKELNALKNWRVPATILFLLILATMLRWNVDKSTVNGTSISKYKTDRWNGAIYHEMLTIAYYNKFTIKEQTFAYDWDSSDNLTKIWSFAVGGCSIWLLYSLSGLKKKKSVEG